MVSLTALLVLVSLFSQTSEKIPKTAYLKLIDVWFVVLIVFDFLVIVLIVFIEYLRLKSQQRQLSYKIFVSGKFPTKDEQKIFLESATSLNKISRIIFPMIILVFVSIFGYLAMANLSKA